MSTPHVSRGPRVSRRAVEALALLLVLALVAALAFVLWPREHENTATVDFDRTVSLYKGSTVRILGVDVGRVESITPRGTTVRVKLAWDSTYEVPADVKAVIVSPSVVGDRFVQLTPAYTSGPKLADGAFLDQSRTATPTELDETFASLDQLSRALGPEGANANGDLSRVLSSAADNLDGRGEEIRRSIAALAKVTTTADGSKDELFASMKKLQTFVSALEKNDASVRSFNASLASVSDVLAGESTDLQLAVRDLAGALQMLRTYVEENRTGLRKNVAGLTNITTTLAKQRDNLAKILDRGPQALANLAATYNPTTGTIDTRGTIKQANDGTFTSLTTPDYVQAYCALSYAQDPKYADACRAVSSVIQWLSSRVPGGAKVSTTATASTPRDGLASMMGVQG